jgi:hypothetical protein
MGMESIEIASAFRTPYQVVNVLYSLRSPSPNPCRNGIGNRQDPAVLWVPTAQVYEYP